MPKVFDILAAVLSSLKAVPVVGPALANPVLRLYDQEKSDVFSAQIEAAIESGTTMRKEVLAEILEIKEILASPVPESGEKLLGLEILTLGINNAHKGEKVISGRISTTGWPFPFTEDVLLRELYYLFVNNSQVLRIALTQNGWTVREKHQNDEVILQFVKDIPGRASKLKPIIDQLLVEKPDSLVLQAVECYLTASQEQR